MTRASQVLSTDVGLPLNSYIYKIISTAPRQDPLTYSKTDQLAIISSDDSLHFLDLVKVHLEPDGGVQNVNSKVTCLERTNDAASNVVATAGRDGLIRFWDKRSRQKALEIQSRKHSSKMYACATTARLIGISAQTRLITGLRCPKELYCCWHRKSGRWPRRVTGLHLVCQLLEVCKQ
jgi:WD40 repeat protein